MTFSDNQPASADAQSASWIRTVQPAGSDAMSHSVLPEAYVAELVDRVGPGPIGWAIEVAVGMAESILEAVPELGVDGVVQEMRKGCQAVAVRLVAALAEEDLDPNSVLSPERWTGGAVPCDGRTWLMRTLAAGTAASVRAAGGSGSGPGGGRAWPGRRRSAPRCARCRGRGR